MRDREKHRERGGRAELVAIKMLPKAIGALTHVGLRV